MAKIHDLFIVELAEVIKGYGNEPDDEDPFRLSEFYRFYELPNIAVSRENFEKMRPIAAEIIHCRDCKHYGGYDYCYEVDGLWHDDDYCSKAERWEEINES